MKIQYKPIWSNTLSNELSATGSLTKAKQGWLKRGDIIQPITHSNYSKPDFTGNYFGTALEPWAKAYIKQFGKKGLSRFNILDFQGVVIEIKDGGFDLVLEPGPRLATPGSINLDITWFSDWDAKTGDDDVSEALINTGGDTLVLDKGNNNEGVFVQVKGDSDNNTCEDGSQPYILMTFLPLGGLTQNPWCPAQMFNQAGWENQTWINQAEGSGAYSTSRISYDASDGSGLRDADGNDCATMGGWTTSHKYALSYGLKETDKMKGAFGWAVNSGDVVPMQMGYIVDYKPLSDLPSGSDGYLYFGPTLEVFGDAGGTEGLFDFDDDGSWDGEINTQMGMWRIYIAKKAPGNTLSPYTQEGSTADVPTEDMWQVIDGEYDAPAIFPLDLRPFGTTLGGVWGNAFPSIKFDGEKLFDGVSEPGNDTTTTETQNILIESSRFTTEEGNNYLRQVPNMGFWTQLDPALTSEQVTQQYFIDGEMTFDGNLPYVSVESDHHWVDEETVGIRIMNPIRNVTPSLGHIQNNGAEMTVTFETDETGDYVLALFNPTYKPYGSVLGSTVTVTSAGAQSVTIAEATITAYNLEEDGEWYVKVINDGDNSKWARGMNFTVAESLTGLEITAPTADTAFNQGASATINWNTTEGGTSDDSGE